MATCDDFSLFYDGEMTASAAEEFRRHLVDCAACQNALSGAFWVGVFVEPAFRRRWPWWRRAWWWVRQWF